MKDSPVYSALDREADEVRLLELQPGARGDKIRCILSIVRLSETPEYEALSYVWGNKDETFDVFLNGQTFSALKSLRICLRELRRQDGPRILWIDSFCINQNNVLERGHQVKMMGQIYRSAAKVLVWIGDSHRLTRNTLKSFQHYDMNRPNGASINSHPFSIREAMLQVASFFECTWWSRVWTLQELLLSNELEFCWYSSPKLSKMTWTELADASLSAFIAVNTSSLQEVIHNSDSSATEIVGWIAKTQIIESHKHACASNKVLYTTDIIALSQERRCTDPRDKVYGLLGLASDIATTRIDYSLPVAEIYQQCVVDSMQTTGSLAILNLRRSFRQTRGLASWATNWMIEQHTDPYEVATEARIPEQSGLFSTGSFAPAQIAYVGTQKLLCAGKVYDEVLAVFSTATTAESDALTDTMSKWYTEVKPNEPYVAGGSRHDAFCRTICEDISCSNPDQGHLPYQTVDDLFEMNRSYVRLKPETKISSFTEAWRSFQATEYDHHRRATRLVDFSADPVRSYYVLVRLTCAGKRMFVTKKGYIGLGHSVVQPGDHVAILIGAERPFVVRPVHSGRERTEYTLHGSCYVHGIMDGEAVEQLNLRPRPFPFITLV